MTIFSKVKCLKINGVKLIKRKEDGRTGREFIKCIADTVREKCSQIIKQSNFLSLLSDGSQARKTSKEKELILLRTQRNGHPEYLVISLLEMSRFGGATANAIIDGINSIFQDKKSKFYMSSDEFQSKVVSATADGASVNFGQYSGVLSQLKEDRPWMLKIHCINHRVELSVKSAFSHPLLDNVDKFYKSNFYLLRNSGKLKEMIREAAATIGIAFYNLPKIHGTRFIGHRRRGLTSLLEIWPAIAMAYESYATDNQNIAATRAKVTSLLKKFHSYNFLVIVETYLDLLEVMVPVSKIFETSELLPHQIPPTIKSTLMTLELKIDEIGKEDEFLDSYVRRYKVAAVDGDDCVSGEFVRAGEKRKKSSNQNLFEVMVPMKRIKEDAALKKVRHLRKFYVWIILLLSEEYYWKLSYITFFSLSHFTVNSPFLYPLTPTENLYIFYCFKKL